MLLKTEHHLKPNSQISFYFVSMSVSPVYMYVHYVGDRCSQRPGNGFRPSEIEVKDACEPTCRSWELHLGPLQERQMLSSEPSLQTWLDFKTDLCPLEISSFRLCHSIFSTVMVLVLQSISWARCF